MAAFESKQTYPGETSAFRPVVVGEDESMSLLGWRGSNNINLNLAFLARNLVMQPKTTEQDTSQVAPALAHFQGHYVIAWVGDDGNRSINVALLGFDGDGSHACLVDKQQLGHSSTFAPALASSGDALYLAWAGRDGEHTVNVMRSTDGLHFEQNHKWGGHSTFHSPALAFNGGRGILGYIALNGRLRLVEIDNLGNPEPGFVNETGETSSHDPAVTAWGPKFAVAWTGDDGAGTLNVAEYDPSPSPSLTKDIFGDTSVFGPSLTVRRLRQDPHSNVPDVLQLEIAWTGSDNAHSLNAAVVRSRNA